MAPTDSSLVPGVGWWPAGRSRKIVVRLPVLLASAVTVAALALGGRGGAEILGLTLLSGGLTLGAAGAVRTGLRQLRFPQGFLDRSRDLDQVRGRRPWTADDLPRLRRAADLWGRQLADGMLCLLGGVVALVGGGLSQPDSAAAAAFVVVVLGLLGLALRPQLRTARAFLEATAHPR